MRTLDSNPENLDQTVDWSNVDAEFQTRRQEAVAYLADLSQM